MLSFIFVCISGSFAAVAPSPPGEDVRAVVDRAEDAFARGDYDAASEHFARAFELEDDRHYLYAWAQAERLGGDCEAAVELYRQFLTLEPPQTEADLARENLERCGADPEPTPAVTEPVSPEPTELTEPKDEPAPAVQIRPAEPEPRDRDSRDWLRDPVGGVLSGVGIAAMAAGAGVLGHGFVLDGDAPSAPTEDEFVDRKDRARTQVIAGAATLGVGSALLLGGIVRYVVVRRRSRVTPSMSWNRGPSVSVRVEF